MAEVLETHYDVRFDFENLGSLDELRKTMTSARRESPDEPWKWLGMHYNAFTIDGSTLLGATQNERYPNLKVDDLASFCKKYNLEELPTLFN